MYNPTKVKIGVTFMKVANSETHSPEQLANADLALKMLTALPEDPQRFAAMVANIYLDGWMARELFAGGPAPTPPAAQGPRPGA